MKQLLFSLHADSPKYIQIYERMRGLIEQGKLVKGEKLPSIRALAEQLYVSRNTTLQAYELLMAEGYIYSAEKKGYFVHLMDPIHLNEIQPGLPITHESKTDAIDFRLGAINQANFPLKTWRKISNAVLKQESSYTYGEPFGEVQFKREIANYLFQARGVVADPQQIIIGSNTQQLLLHISFILKQFSHSIALENPGYLGAREVFELQNFEVEPINVNEDGLDLSRLEQLKSSLLYITPSHQYPFGTALPIQQRVKLVDWADNCNGFILEDDYDGEFRYGQKTFPALASLNRSRIIYLGTFSKAFLPGVRLAYMVLPESLLLLYRERFKNFEHNASLLHQLAMTQFMQCGEWERHIRRMRKVYRRKMELLKEQVELKLKNTCEIIGTNAGLYVALKLNTHFSEEQLIMKAKQQNVIVYPVNELFIDKQSSSQYILLGFANLSDEQIIQGVEGLQNAWG